MSLTCEAKLILVKKLIKLLVKKLIKLHVKKLIKLLMKKIIFYTVTQGASKYCPLLVKRN